MADKITIYHVYNLMPLQHDCILHLEKILWDNKPACPYCKSSFSTYLQKENRHHCNTCNTTFSVTVGTLFHKTKVDLQKWFLAILMVLEDQNVSTRQLGKIIGVTKDTASLMLVKIRKGIIEYRVVLEKIIAFLN